MTGKPTYKELEQRVENLEREAAKRKRLEKQLRLLSFAVEQSTEGIAMSDLDGNIEYLNNSFAEMHGYSAEELVGKNLSIFHTPEQMASVEAANLEIKETGSFQGEIWHVSRDENVFPSLMHNSMIMDETGKPIGMMGTLRDISDMKQAEEKLRESEERLAAFMDSATDGFILFDSELNYLKMNKAGQEITGADRKEVIGKNVLDVIPDFKETGRYYKFKKVAKTGMPLIMPDLLPHPKFGGKHLNVKVFKVGDGLGVIFTDITERKQIEEALQKAHDKLEQRIKERTVELLKTNERLMESKEHFRKLAEGSFEAIVLHEEGVIINANDQYYEMFGYNPEELAGKDAVSLTATLESTESIKKQILLGNLGPYEVTGVKKDGTKFPMEVRIKLTSYKENEVRMAVIRNLTERNQAEEALSKQRNHLRSLLESASGFVVYRLEFDENAPYMLSTTFVSPSIKEILGIDPENWSSKTFFENIHPEEIERVEEANRKAFETGKFDETCRFYNSQKDEWIWIHAISTGIRDDKGKPTHVNGIIIDVTEKQMAEEALQKAYDELDKLVEDRTKELSISYKLLEKEVIERRQAEKQIKTSLLEKEVLLGEIHHRVKNNFEIVSSLLDLSRMRAENKETQNYLMDAQTRIHSMALIHDQLYQKDQFDRVNMGEHIKELVDSLFILYASSEKRINFVIEPSQVYLSVTQAIPCSLVLNELIANAFKHGFIKKRKGNVWVSIDDKDGGAILLRVKDDGDGFPESFELNEATGLGLKIVRHLVFGQLKGEMRVNHDDGAEVYVQFKRLL